MNLAVLSLAAAQDRNLIASKAAWILLADFNYNGQHVRLARNVDPITFDAGDGLGPQVYAPFAFELDGASVKNDGSLPQISLKVSNVNRLVEGAIIQYNGAAGCTCTLYVMNTDSPAGEAELALEMQVVRSTTDAKWVTFTMGAASPLRTLFPKHLYLQGTCRNRYKGTRCGYTGALATCDLSFSGTNGCVTHNNQQRYGAFPGIATNGATIASQI